MLKKEFEAGAIIQYNAGKKFMSGLILVSSLAAVAVLVGVYLSFWRDSDFFILNWARAVLSHISSNLDLPSFQGSTMLGAFYASAIGGLFVVVTSLEGIFLALLNAGHPPVLLTIIYLLGILMSYSINYLVGSKLSGGAKKLIGPKKFYKLKGVINKHGALAIFGFNVLPLPSQPLAAILGAVKYNKTRFYIFFMAGNIVKFAALCLGKDFFVRIF